MVNFSFIIPHYDLSSNLLRRCLDSIPHNDDVQIIVVDDHSPSLYDDKGNLIDAKKLEFVGYGEKCTETLFLDKNQGPGNARNEGLKLAKGKWVLFCDPDDCYETNELLALLNNPYIDNYDLIYFGYRNIEEDGTVDNRTFGYMGQEIQLIEELSQFWKDNHQSCIKMIKSSIIEGLAYPSAMVLEDVPISLQLLERSKRNGFFPKVVYNYYRRSISLTRKRDLKKDCQGMDIAIKGNKFLKKKKISLDISKIYLGYIKQESLPIFVLYFIKEVLLVGWSTALRDYCYACHMTFASTNPFCWFINPIRVWLGAILHK